LRLNKTFNAETRSELAKGPERRNTMN